MASSIRTSVLLALGVLVAAAGCTTKKTEAPPVSGPSELAIALQLQATPDTLSQDGVSQSTLTITARDPNSQPVRSLPLRVDIMVEGAIQDFGRLSAKNVTTGSDGRTQVTYTAPKSIDSVDHGTVVRLLVTPVDGDFGGSQPRFASIRLVPPGVITPPTIEGPDFTIEPDSAPILSPVTVTATLDPDRGDVSRFSWSFGDGGTATGITATHTYHRSGSFPITLTVTYSSGVTARATKLVTITPSDDPEPEFAFSPSEPAPNDKVFFNAAESKVTPPRRIVSYKWTFGDGATATGVTVSHTYNREATFNVTLTVTDDSGHTASISKEVTVAEPED
jgi:PKD repeat protein